MATTMGYDITNREDIFMPENDIVDVRKQRMTDEDKRLITEWLGGAVGNIHHVPAPLHPRRLALPRCDQGEDCGGGEVERVRVPGKDEAEKGLLVGCKYPGWEGYVEEIDAIKCHTYEEATDGR